MYFVYIIKNSVTGKYYIGSTADLVRRLSEHNRGQTKSTNRAGIWEHVYTEEFVDRISAIRREKEIKSYKGGNGFKRLVNII